MTSIDRVARRYLEAKKIDLKTEGLQGLVDGKPTVLYHGSTKFFRQFDISKSRGILVNKYYGKGIFLTPSKRVAWKYAEANRNIGFDPGEIIPDMKKVNPLAGAFLEELFKEGLSAWDKHTNESGIIDFDNALKVDGNTLGDIAAYILGSKVSMNHSSGPDMFFNTTPQGAPDYIYDSLDEVGLDSKKYRPKVYTAVVKVQNPLVTSRKSQAQKARSNGYDSVIFHGANLVDGVPEVALFSNRLVTIRKVEVE